MFSQLQLIVISRHVLFTCALRERTLSTTHRNVIVPAVSRRWPGLDFKMILHHVRYVRRVGHDWADSGWRAFTALASGPGRRRWSRWSTTTSFRRLMAFYQAVETSIYSRIFTTTCIFKSEFFSTTFFIYHFTRSWNNRVTFICVFVFKCSLATFEYFKGTDFRRL